MKNMRIKGTRYCGYAEALEAFNQGLRVDIVSECEGAGYERAWDGKEASDVYKITLCDELIACPTCKRSMPE